MYAQDDWRAKSWLTLNIGLRYDIFTPYTEVHGRISNYDPYLGLLISPSLPGIQQSSATAGVPTPYGDVAPRFGFAATLGHGTVLRGGFGTTFFTQNWGSQYFFQNAPFNYSENCTIQNGGNSNSSCATAQFDGPVGQFASAQTLPLMAHQIVLHPRLRAARRTPALLVRQGERLLQPVSQSPSST